MPAEEATNGVIFSDVYFKVLTVAAVIPGNSLNRPTLGFMQVWTQNAMLLLHLKTASHITGIQKKHYHHHLENL